MFVGSTPNRPNVWGQTRRFLLHATVLYSFSQSTPQVAVRTGHLTRGRSRDWPVSAVPVLSMVFIPFAEAPPTGHCAAQRNFSVEGFFFHKGNQGELWKATVQLLSAHVGSNSLGVWCPGRNGGDGCCRLPGIFRREELKGKGISASNIGKMPGAARHGLPTPPIGQWLQARQRCGDAEVPASVCE